MILSPASQATAATALFVASAVAAGAYLLLTLTRWSQPENEVRARALMAAGWLAHGVALFIDIGGVGLDQPATRFGFAPALSATLWLVIAVYLIESRLLPLAGARRVLCGLGVLIVALAAAFQGSPHPTVSPWAPLHWLLGLASYGLFGAAVLHALLLNRAERQLRLKTRTPQGEAMPLLQLERLTFQFVAAGVIVLSAAIVLGWSITAQWRWDHKTLLSLLGWFVLTGLLIGRQVFGWRGRLATRWLYVGAVLLLLAYAGSRFVFEVILHRPPVA